MTLTTSQIAMAVNGVLTERWSNLFKQFEGKRNVYDSAGYPQNVGLDDYVLRYSRQDLATRIVEIFADYTWKGEVLLQDTEGKNDSPFESAWRELIEAQLTEDGDTQIGIAHYLNRVDVVAGLGHYAVLLLGLRDGKELSEPVEAGSLDDTTDLLYVSVFGEDKAKIASYELDTGNRRFGKPLYYSLSIMSGENETIHKVHWTRCIHVADGALTNDLLGKPRLENIFNRLIDLEKVLAATGEGGWHVMNPATIFTTQEGYELPRPDSSMPQEMQTALEAARTEQAEQIDELVHGLRRALTLEGLDPIWQPTSLSDPSGAVDTFLKLVSAGTGIPLRILTGSERGELASSQDEDAWNNLVDARRHKFAEPLIVRPVVNRLRWAGVLPEPAESKFAVNWESLQAEDMNATAERAQKVAGALQTIGAKVEAKAFAQTYLKELPENSVEEAPEPAQDGQINDPQNGAAQDQQDSAKVAANVEFVRRWRQYP